MRFLLAFAISVFCAADVSAGQFQVTKTQDTNDGSCDADCSLREAIVDANTNVGPDSILIPAGTYTISIDGVGEDNGLSGDLDITDSLVLSGVGAASTIIDGAGLDRVFDACPGTSCPANVSIELASLTIQNGVVHEDPPIIANEDPTGTGGGLRSRARLLTLREVTVQNNLAREDGAGVSVYEAGRLDLVQSQVSGNRGAIGRDVSGAVAGLVDSTPTEINVIRSMIVDNIDNLFAGAGIASGNGPLTIVDSEVSRNEAFSSNGGGGLIYRKSLRLVRSTVADNRAVIRAGIRVNCNCNDGCPVEITDSTISGNVASSFTGAMNLQCANNVITNSTITGNLALQGQGGIAGDTASVRILNSTISDNSGAGVCDGICLDDDQGSSSFTVELQNTIISGNDCGAGVSVSSAGFNIESADTCGLDHPFDRVNLDPQIGLLADNGGPTFTRALLPGSPAIDTGDPGGCRDAVGMPLVSDQRGLPRSQTLCDQCDIGAFETSITDRLTVTKIADTADGSCDADCSLREAVIAANTMPGRQAIDIPAGTYSLSIAGISEDLSATGDLDLREGVALVGAGAEIVQILAAPADRIFEIPSDVCSNPGLGLFSVCGLTLSDGSPSDSFGSGGGLLQQCGVAQIVDSILEGHSAVRGAALHNIGGLHAFVRSVAEQNNSASEGGGIDTWDPGATYILDSIVRDNSSDNGGGIWSESGSFTRLDGSTVHGNIATLGVGGGLGLLGDAEIVNSTVSGNDALQGAGVWTRASLVLRNATLVGNQASSVPGAVTTNFQMGRAQNTIIEDGCSGAALVSEGHNIDAAGTCGLALETDQIGVSAELAPLADNGGPTPTHLPVPGSPSIDAGDPTGCIDLDGRPLIVDQRRQPRPRDGDADNAAICDIGAVEVLPTRCGDVDVDGALTASDVTLFRLVLAQSTSLTPAGVARCRTQSAAGTCDASDLAILRRTVEGPALPPGPGTACTAFTP